MTHQKIDILVKGMLYLFDVVMWCFGVMLLVLGMFKYPNFGWDTVFYFITGTTLMLSALIAGIYLALIPTYNDYNIP